ncbi:hypothetical protein ACOMHN_004895 [Nucella lapillus]
MTVVGLPTTLEVTLGALLQENHLTSWKIAGEVDNTTVVLRLKTRLSNVNMASQPTPTTPQVFRRKPISQINRDKRRAEEWRRVASRQDECQASEYFTSGNSQGLFMPTPPETHSVTNTNMLLSPNDTPPHMSGCARDFRREPRAVTVATASHPPSGNDQVCGPTADTTTEHD